MTDSITTPGGTAADTPAGGRGGVARPSMDAVRRWYDDYRRDLPLTPLEDMGTLKEQLDLTHAHPNAISRLFTAGSVPFDLLFRDVGALKSAERTFGRIINQYYDIEHRYGTASMSLAVGVASWGKHRMPVLLFPLVADALGSEDEPKPETTLHITGGATINSALIEALASSGVLVDVDDLMDPANYGNQHPDSSDLFEALRAKVSGRIADFELSTTDMIVGCFLDPAIVMLSDAAQIINRMGKGGVSSLPLAMLSGDERAASALMNRKLPTYVQQDRDPHDETEAGDVSNATRYAAKLAADGESVFINTAVPDDTAVQSLAVASRVIMQGKSVLYVPGVDEQRHRFLREAHRAGMGDLTGDLTSAKFDSWLDGRLVEAAKASYRLSGAMTQFDQVADELVGVRVRVSRYLGDLHAPSKEWGVSAYEVIENLALISSRDTHPATRVRLSKDAAHKVADDMDAWCGRLREAGSLGEFTIRPEDTPWYHASVYNEGEAVDVYQRIERVLGDTLPAVRGHIAATVDACGFEFPRNSTQWGRQVTFLCNLRRVLDMFDSDIFKRDIPELIEATKSKEERKEKGTTLRMGERHRLSREARSLVRVGARVDDLHAALIAAQKEKEEWRGFVSKGDKPVLPMVDLGEIVKVEESLMSDLTALDSVLATTPDKGDLESLGFEALDKRLRALFDDRKALDTLPRRSSLERDIAQAGLTPLTDDLAARTVTPDAAPDELRLAWWATVFDDIVGSSPVIANQDGSVLTQAAERFRKLDEQHVESIGPMVAQEMSKRLFEKLSADSWPADQLHTALQSATPPTFLRIQRDFGSLVEAACPILVATPAALAALSRPTHVADVAIIDAGAHMPAVQLLTVLARVNNVVIIGHRDTVTCPAITMLNSALVQVNTLQAPTGRDARVVRFLQSNGYGDLKCSLTTTRERGDVEYRLVKGTGMPNADGIVESTRQEVVEVANIVEGRIAEFPRVPRNYRLVIICLTEAHRERIGAELRTRAQRTSGLLGFLRHVRIVTLNEVAGASADDVVLACSFGKSGPSHMTQRFGVLNRPGADRMLLDALAVSTSRLTVVSSFGSADMEDAQLRHPGARMLKRLLAWCENLPAEVPMPQGHPSEDIIINDLATRIRARGLSVEVNYGFETGFRVPLVVGASSSSYRLAILTDDAQFMAFRSLRQRYRFNVENLEGLGWSVMFSWSVAAFVDPDKEVDRIVGRLPMAGGTL